MRRAKPEDVGTLLKLAKMVHFINLPADKDIIADKAQWSRQCFLKAAEQVHGVTAGSGGSGGSRSARGSTPRPGDRGAGPVHAGTSNAVGGLAADVSRSDLFMFVLEDTESGGVLGTSQIISRMGGPGRPNVSLRLSKKEMFSKSLQMGTTHMVAKLHLDETGPTEIGGLILQPSYRGHKAKLGRFLSLVRFHFMGLFPQFFSDRVIAEMMAPITPDGQNTLWEYLGRRFINLTYPEADRFCQYSKEFITALMPREEIYLTLLPPEARSVVAQVGPETVPARRMLEKLGFAYKDLIDPFDGGPTLEAATADISTVRHTRRVQVARAEDESAITGTCMLSVLDDAGEFRAVQAPCSRVDGDQVSVMPDVLETLQVQPGDEVGFTPIDDERPATSKRGATSASVGKASSSTNTSTGTGARSGAGSGTNSKKRPAPAKTAGKHGGSRS